MHSLRNLPAILALAVLGALVVFTGSSAVLDASQASVSAAPLAQSSCTPLASPQGIPSPGLIHFDELTNGAVIGTTYQSSHGVVFENSGATRALVYGNEPAEAQSPPNTAINDAVRPGGSTGVPMRIDFDTPKTHVGMWLGNGETIQPDALLTAYDVQGAILCQARLVNVPEAHTAFLGLHDQTGQIRAVELDYGQTSLSESIDDLYFAPYSAVPGPAATPTRVPVATWTPVPPTPIPPGPTPTATPPIYAVPFMIPKAIIAPQLIKPDLSIHGIELTQGIQCFDTSDGLASCPDNSLPLANKKDTAARIYLKYSSVFGTSMSSVPVRLHIRANGVWYTANTSGKATNTINQANSDSALVYFNVNFTNDVVVDFYAEVDPNNVITESNELNNRYPTSGFVTLTFRKRGTLKIVGQRLRYHPSGYTGNQYAGGWAVNGGAADFFEQLLPIRDNGINYSVKSGYLSWTKSLTPCGSGSGPDNQHDLIKTLNYFWILDNALSFWFGTGAFTGADHVYGWAPDAGYPCGHADMPVYPHAGGLGVVGIGTDAPGTSTDSPGAGALIFVHELLHDYDLKHTDTGADDCGSNDSSSAFPYSTSSIQEFGFNPYTGKIYDPAATHDVMSYCPAGGSKEGWISPYTWNFMSADLDASSSSAGASPDSPIVRLGTENMQVTSAQESLVVNATVFNPAHPAYDPNQPGALGDLYKVQTGLAYPLPDGDYAVELRRGGLILATESFSVTFQSEYDPLSGGHTGTTQDDPVFPSEDTLRADVSFIMPWVDIANNVVLLHQGQVLAQKDISLGAPTVTITNPTKASAWPAGSMQKLQWTGSDPDGDPLSYGVMYSHDGGVTWQLLEAGLTQTTYDVDVDAMAGGSDVRFRVVATDGVNSGYAETPDVISIPNKAPMVTILDPEDGQVFPPGGVVLLKGSATDLEDGGLSDGSLHWSSDIQGSLGIGPSIPLNNLQQGTHMITLSGTDSLGVAGSQSVSVFIGYELYLPTIHR